MNTKLLPCPFCGETPIFSDVEERDDRRYMRMLLECCITMSASIGYSKFKYMSDKEVKDYLTSKLINKWNSRLVTEDEEDG